MRETEGENYQRSIWSNFKLMVSGHVEWTLLIGTELLNGYQQLWT